VLRITLIAASCAEAFFMASVCFYLSRMKLVYWRMAVCWIAGWCLLQLRFDACIRENEVLPISIRTWLLAMKCYAT
jgi:hypothetical protein